MAARIEDISGLIDYRHLKPGDILIMRREQQDFYAHVMVVSAIDPTQHSYQLMHWVASREPFVLQESAFPSADRLARLHLSFECFRPHNEDLALQAVAVLKSWLDWSLPYDAEKRDRAEKYNAGFFSIHSDMNNKKYPDLSQFTDRAAKLKTLRQDMSELFEKHIMDPLKYAARRKTCPIRPRPIGERQPGFHCVQGVLLAYQVACAQDFIEAAEPKQWVSGKTGQGLTGVEDLLSPDFDKQSLLAAFPPALRLYAKLCEPNTLHHALVQDTVSFSRQGIVTLPDTDPLELDSDKAVKQNRSQLGEARRNALWTEMSLAGLFNIPQEDERPSYSVH